MKTKITNCYIKTRDNDEIMFLENPNKDGSCFVTLDKMIIVPIETSQKELRDIMKEARKINDISEEI